MTMINIVQSLWILIGTFGAISTLNDQESKGLVRGPTCTNHDWMEHDGRKVS